MSQPTTNKQKEISHLYSEYLEQVTPYLWNQALFQAGQTNPGHTLAISAVVVPLTEDAIPVTKAMDDAAGRYIRGKYGIEIIDVPRINFGDV